MTDRQRRLTFETDRVAATTELIQDCLPGLDDVEAVPLACVTALLSDIFAPELDDALAGAADMVAVQESFLVEMSRPFEREETIICEGSFVASANAAVAKLAILDLYGAKRARVETRVSLLDPQRLHVATQPKRQSSISPEGMRSEPLSPNLVARFADVVADRNPVHLDRARAKAMGLPERVVHGTLVAALGVEAARNASAVPAGRVIRASARFLAPVFVGTRASFACQAGSASGRSRITVTRGDTAIACVVDATFAE